MSDTTTIDPRTGGEQQSEILLSEAASASIKEIIQQQDLDAAKVFLRVGVKGGGCSGFTYTLDLVEEEAGENDEILEHRGIRILVDSKSLLYLSGTKIDFRDEIMGRGFVFSNPNASTSCGCGSSFAV